ncbi:MAG: PspA/IM30 family protein [Candidatus Promineifilaceae bacterium]|jgi:phage shock protein A
MPGPFKRLGKKLQDALMTPAEDPRRTYESAYDKQRALLIRVRTALSEVAKAKSRLEEKAQITRAKLPDLEALARQALLDGREDLARLRLQRRRLAQIQLQSLNQQLLEIEREEHRLSLAEQRLTDQLVAFRTRQELLAARYSAAEAQVYIGEALTGVSEELAGLNQAMAAAEQKSAQMEARAAAIDRLVDEGMLEIPTAVDYLPSQELLLSNGDMDIEDQLAALKKQLNTP